MAKPVTPDEAVQELCRAVIVQAVEDFILARPVTRKNAHANFQCQFSAFEFLISPDFEVWAEAAGRDFDVNVLFKSLERGKQMLKNRRKL